MTIAAGKIVLPELFSDFGFNGGQCVGSLEKWSKLVETRREDGNDSVALELPLRISDRLALSYGQVVKLTREDGSISEDLLYKIERTWNAGTTSAECSAIGVRSYLATHAVTNHIFPAHTPVATMLGAIFGFYTLPTGFTVGTVPIVNMPAVTWSGDNSLSALLKVIDAINGTLAAYTPPCVAQFDPTVVGGIVTGYTINVLTTPATPDPPVHFAQGVNLGELKDRDDNTDPTFPIKGYALLVDDVYRWKRRRFPNHALRPYQMAHLEVPARALSTMQRIVAVVTDHKTTVGTQVELGTPVRRQPVSLALQQQETVALIDALPPPSVILSIVPLSVTSTQVVLRVFAATPASNQNVTIAYSAQPSGLAITPASGQLFAGLTTLGTTGHVDFTITRQQFGGQASNIDFVATALGHLDAAMSIGIETVSDLASATKTVRFDASMFQPLGNYTCAINFNGSIQSQVGAGLEQYRTGCYIPEGVTITQLVANLLGSGGFAQLALLRGDSTVVGSALVSSSGSLADYTEALSEVVGTGASASRYALLLSFNGGTVNTDRMLRYVIVSYTSPSLQNTY